MVKVQRAIASTRPEVGCMIKSTPEMMPSAIPTAASLNVGSASQISRGRGYTTNQPAKDNQNTIVTTPKIVDVFFNDCFLPNALPLSRAARTIVSSQLVSAAPLVSCSGTLDGI